MHILNVMFFYFLWLLLQEKNEVLLHLNHSVHLLKKLGLSESAAVTVNSGSHRNGSYFYTFNSSAGSEMVRAGTAYRSCFPGDVL